jgi:hypothetical protein
MVYPHHVDFTGLGGPRFPLVATPAARWPKKEKKNDVST